MITALTPGVLDELAVAFGRALRHVGIPASPAEVIEVRRVMAFIGASDLQRLRCALRAVSVKYGHERPLFEIAFDVYFDLGEAPEPDANRAVMRSVANDLPDDVDWDDDFVGAGRMIGADEHTEEIGALMIDDPDARERTGESSHREDDDFSVSSGTEELQVATESSTVGSGATYTIDVDHASAADVGELVGTGARVESGSLSLADAAGLLRALGASDGRAAYQAEGVDDAVLNQRQRESLQEALARFVAALSDRLEATSDARAGAAADPKSQVHRDQADIDRACHRLVQRMRGAPRRVPRLTDRGRLDMRATMRSAVATDGVPVELWRRRVVPGPVRLLVMVDVSLSVRPVAGFILRLAQTLHRFGDRCEVIAFVDRPVLVTSALRSASSDDALAAVLAADGLDLAATSDYGRVWTETLDVFGDLVSRRTSVLVVGDARSNAFDPRVDLFADLARRSHRVAWLTPEPSRYWGQTGCALDDYEEHCAGVVSARDGAEILTRCDELGAALG
ncbi:hypothetical protein SAMN04488550_1627 [Gordonia malaquae]|uniref:VWFA domain-containing protein n=1 Tax=Gordonia malaquae NBRC 108250 TaxID=1223542 RepID=M3TJA1_GORML|nr:VWA domain-containing protein [Gordonia malaquae]GAC81591.1 hypothetical protein GM1_039_00050 [Gordonia malaquae NBRC 108250]SEC31447.1 hypothetical protein SAMN04488550_1627 [Gordonia malaquae]